MTNLLFVDVETTGLDTSRHHLLEVAFAVVTPDLDVVAEHTTTLGYDLASIGTLIGRSDQKVINMHTASGLWGAAAGGTLALQSDGVATGTR